MNDVNKTLYIPLYGKAFVSRKGCILHDSKAEEIWAAEGFSLSGKSRSKWLAYYMGMRAAVFDRWLERKIAEDPAAVVVHIGCGMDSRCLRAGSGARIWYDIDFPDVIAERRRYFRESERYRMLSADVTKPGWLEHIPGENAIVVMEGVSMYLQPETLKAVLCRMGAHFARMSLLMDCYSAFAAKVSKVKNPINDVGVTQVYGLDDPRSLEGDGLAFLCEQEMTPEHLIGELPKAERMIFRKLYAGKFAGGLYRLYEYQGGKQAGHEQGEGSHLAIP